MRYETHSAATASIEHQTTHQDRQSEPPTPHQDPHTDPANTPPGDADSATILATLFGVQGLSASGVARLRHEITTLHDVTLHSPTPTTHGPDAEHVDAERLAVIEELELLHAAVAAVQAHVVAAYAESQTQTLQETTKRGPQRIAREINGAIAKARHKGSYWGARAVGFAKALVHDMPNLMNALKRGEVCEWGATLVVRATSVLSTKNRRTVDDNMVGEYQGNSAKTIYGTAGQYARELDPEAEPARRNQAVAARRISVRPALDGMAWVSALVQAQDAAAIKGQLDRHAEDAIKQRKAEIKRARQAVKDATTDEARTTAEQALDGIEPLTRGAAASDEFVRRLTGNEPGTPADIQVILVMRGDELDADAPSLGGLRPGTAHVLGYGDMDSALAITWLATAGKATYRRALAEPFTGILKDMDPRARTFSTNARMLVTARDKICKTPYCDAPIRDIDHVHPHSRGGATTIDNAQGLCRLCNITKADTC